MTDHSSIKCYSNYITMKSIILIVLVSAVAINAIPDPEPQPGLPAVVLGLLGKCAAGEVISGGLISEIGKVLGLGGLFSGPVLLADGEQPNEEYIQQVQEHIANRVAEFIKEAEKPEYTSVPKPAERR